MNSIDVDQSQARSLDMACIFSGRVAEWTSTSEARSKNYYWDAKYLCSNIPMLKLVADKFFFFLQKDSDISFDVRLAALSIAVRNCAEYLPSGVSGASKTPGQSTRSNLANEWAERILENANLLMKPPKSDAVSVKKVGRSVGPS